MSKGQQEMVGFVLIVVLVVVGLMIFLVLSIDNEEDLQSREVENLLDVFMRTSSECAIVFEPQYDSFEELIKSCYNNERCSNLDEMACDYLNSSSREVLDDLMASESQISYYDFSVYYEDEGREGILNIAEGNCSGSVKGAQRIVSVPSGKIYSRLRFCY